MTIKTFTETLLEPTVVAGIFQGSLNLLASILIAVTALYVTYRLTKDRASTIKQLEALDEIEYLRTTLKEVAKSIAPLNISPSPIAAAKRAANEKGFYSTAKFTPSSIARKRRQLSKDKDESRATAVL